MHYAAFGQRAASNRNRKHTIRELEFDQVITASTNND